MNHNHAEGCVTLMYKGDEGMLTFVDFAAQSQIPGQHYDVVDGEYEGQDALGKSLKFTYRIHVFMNPLLPHDRVVRNIRNFVNQHGATFTFATIH